MKTTTKAGAFLLGALFLAPALMAQDQPAGGAAPSGQTQTGGEMTPQHKTRKEKRGPKKVKKGKAEEKKGKEKMEKGKEEEKKAAPAEQTPQQPPTTPK